MFSKCFHFVILTVIFMLLQSRPTFSVVYNMHLCFVVFKHVAMSIINEYNEYSLIISGNEYKHKQDSPRSVVAGTMKMENFKYKYITEEERVCF
jgi:hypothetical protein